MDYDVGYKDGSNDAFSVAQRDVSKLLKAVKNTLAENAHLADGDNCTLKELRDAYADLRKLHAWRIEKWVG